MREKRKKTIREGKKIEKESKEIAEKKRGYKETEDKTEKEGSREVILKKS